MKSSKFLKLSILGWNFKRLMSYLKSTSLNLLTCKVSSKTKDLQICGQRYIIQVFFNYNLIKTIIKYLISTLEFVKLKILLQNARKDKLSTKNGLLNLWVEMFKNYCHICNQHHQIPLIASFPASYYNFQI